MIYKRNDVRIHGFSSELNLGLMICHLVLKEKFGLDLQITGGIEGRHSINSLHHTGDAVDWWPKQLVQNPFEVGPKIVAACKEALGLDFDCVFETKRIHIHLEYQPHTGYVTI